MGHQPKSETLPESGRERHDTPAADGSRKPYKKPTLKSLGSVRELTQVGGTNPK